MIDDLDTRPEPADGTNSVVDRDQTAPTLTLLYFAWVRERIGQAQETIDVPTGVETVSDLMDWLAARGPEYAEVFSAKKKVIRVAVDQTHVDADTAIAGAKEIGFFPPVTGG